MFRTFARNAKKYTVDVDIPGLQKKLQQVPFDECIYSDAKLFINILQKKLLRLVLYGGLQFHYISHYVNLI